MTETSLPDVALSPSMSDLSQDVLNSLASMGTMRRFAANQVILREGEVERAIYILLSGRVRVFAREGNREVVYNELARGDYFGELCLDGEPRSASVATLEPTTCVVVDESHLRDVLAAHPDFALNLILKLIGQFRNVTWQVKRLALSDVYSRVVHFLSEHAQEIDGVQVVASSITQKEIAARVGATREMVNRIISQLGKGGYLKRDERRRLVILKSLPKSW